MREHYQLWTHRDSGQVYAVRFRRAHPRHPPRLVGVTGPLDPHTPDLAGALAGYRYEIGEVAQAIEARRHEFTVHLPRSSAVGDQ